MLVIVHKLQSWVNKILMVNVHFVVQLYSTLAAAHQTNSNVLPPAATSCISQMFRARRRDMPALPTSIRDIDLGQVRYVQYSSYNYWGCYFITYSFVAKFIAALSTAYIDGSKLMLAR